jgi:hypothetical protein
MRQNLFVTSLQFSSVASFHVDMGVVQYRVTPTKNTVFDYPKKMHAV